jgi:hypothetical protein
MKYPILAVLILICSIHVLVAQDNNPKNRKYQTWVILGGDSLVVKGRLGDVKDSAITLTPSIVVRPNGQKIGESSQADISYKDIHLVKVRRKGSIGTGILLGAVGGFVVGGLIGFIEGDDPPQQLFAFTAEEKAIMYGLPLAACGGALGAIPGALKISINIDGKYDNFDKSRKRLKSFAINQ